MKTTLLNLLLLLFLSSLTNAQDFAPIGAKWHFGESYAWSNNVGFITYECIGDTVINNKPCRVIYKSNGTCCIPGGFHFLHQSNDSIFVYNQATESFDLIFRLNAEAGDSWVLKTNPDGNLMSDSAVCVVDSISYFHYSAVDSLRILHVTLKSTTYDIFNGDTSYIEISNQVIEKIGFRYALLPSDCIYFCDVNFEGDIRCYEDSNVGLITFSSLDCEYTPVENMNVNNEIKIYPNPASNKVYVHSPDLKISNIEVFSPEGIQIPIQIPIQINNNELDVNSLKAGVYYVRIRTENGVSVKAISVLK